MTAITAQQTDTLLDALRSNLSLLGEIAMRYAVETGPERPAGDVPSIGSPRDVHDLLGPEMAPLAQEQLRVLLMNIKNQVVGQRVIYQGNVNSSMIRPAEVLRPAVIEAVPSIIVCHNHPSAGPHAQPGGRGHHQGAGTGGQAAGRRAAGPRGHRRGPLRQPQGAGTDVLLRLHDRAACAARLPHGGPLPPRIVPNPHQARRSQCWRLTP